MLAEVVGSAFEDDDGLIGGLVEAVGGDRRFFGTAPPRASEVSTGTHSLRRVSGRTPDGRKVSRSAFGDTGKGESG